jgi:transcriptional regulator with XRE-family HTH domain
MSNIESGSDSSPTLRSLMRYAAALDVDIYVDMVGNRSKENAK